MTNVKYVAVTNIPSHFHAADLRAHFSAFVENKSFLCFHFRHRPEKMREDNGQMKHPGSLSQTRTEQVQTGDDEESSLLASNAVPLPLPKSKHHDNDDRSSSRTRSSDDRFGSRSMSDSNKGTMCCVIKMLNSPLNAFLNKYHDQPWTDVDGSYLANLCHLAIIKTQFKSEGSWLSHSGSNSKAKSCRSISLEDRQNPRLNSQYEGFVAEEDLLSMPELRPPEMMQNGNVGTPTLVFLDLIQKCLLPNSIVKKLHLQFPSTCTAARRLYSNVNFEYDCTKRYSSREKSEDFRRNYKSYVKQKRIFGIKKDNVSISEVSSDSNVNSIKSTLSSTSTDTNHSYHFKHEDSPKKPHEIPVSEQACTQSSAAGSTDFQLSSIRVKSQDPANRTSNISLTAKAKKLLEKEKRRKTRALMDEGIEERLIQVEKRYLNDDDAEEWDRHEATEDDPSNQERNKERLFEEEIEQPWEKGGPGVVFYTDAIYWQAKEGDFDEQTTDDLDVDFSPYEGDGRGDKDIQDFLKIRQEKRFRNGFDKTDRYSIGLSKRPDSNSVSLLAAPNEEMDPLKRPSVLGGFEIHTKGIGRKVMEKQGWHDGQGLGISGSGIKEPIRGKGQRPRVKKGLGFIKSESVTYGPNVLKKARVHQPPILHLITTSKDDPGVTDPKEPLLQRNETTQLKHRQGFLDSHRS